MPASNAAVWGSGSLEAGAEKPDGQTLDDTAIRAEPQEAMGTFTENLSGYSLTNEETASLEEAGMPEETPGFCVDDIRAYLHEKERELEMYEKCEETEGGFPTRVMKEKRMVIAGLRLLLVSEKRKN